MAKTATAEKNELVVAEDHALADEAFLREVSSHAGEGVSTASEDNLIPLVSVLQDMSPQVKQRDPSYVPGAVPGSIILKNLGMVWPGDKGFLFQPCAFSKDWVGWRPRLQGGGYVTRFPERPEGARDAPDPENPKRRRTVIQHEGETLELVETRYHVGFILPEMGDQSPPIAVIIPFSSTGHTVSRGWMARMAQVRLGNGQLAPSRARKYRLTTTAKRNVSGEWFVIKVDDAGWVTLDQFRMGGALHDAYVAGDRRPDVPDDTLAEGDTDIPF